MKRTILLLVLCMLLEFLRAQNVNLDNFWINHSYRKLPNVNIDKSFMTYSVMVSKTAALDIFSNENTINKINIEGRKKLGSGGHFIVYITLGDLIIDNSDVLERVEVIKDKDGNVTGRNYYYKVQVTYSFEASAYIKDYTGYLLKNYSIAERSSKKNYFTNEYNNRSDAANYYNNNRLEIKATLVSEQIENALNSINGILNYDFGFYPINSREKLSTVGSKKHPEYLSFENACNNAKAALEKISVNEMPNEVVELLQPSIDFFIEIPGKYDMIDDKNEKKLRYAAYYDLAEIYFVIEQFDKAKEYAQKVIDNDYDKKDGKQIIEESDKILMQFEEQQIFTRHFTPDIANAQPPQ